MTPTVPPATPTTLSHRQMWERLGISRAQFYRLKAEGRFDHLVSNLPNRYSTERVDAFAANRLLHGGWSRSA